MLLKGGRPELQQDLLDYIQESLDSMPSPTAVVTKNIPPVSPEEILLETVQELVMYGENLHDLRKVCLTLLNAILNTVCITPFN